MAEKFYSLLTKIGKAKIANSIGFGTKINFTKMKVGDGGGSYYEPTEEQTDLKNTVWEGNINHVEIDKDNLNWIHIELMIPATVGGFTIREYGAFDDENNLIGICKCAETYKPVITDGSTKELLLDLILCVVNTENIQLKIDPTIIFAKKSDLEVLDNKINNIKIPVTKVNEKTGDITLKAEDINCNDGKSVESHLDDITKKQEEVFQSVSNGKKNIANAITGKGIKTLASDPFNTMANNISKIKTGYGSGDKIDINKVDIEYGYEYADTFHKDKEITFPHSPGNVELYNDTDFLYSAVPYGSDYFLYKYTNSSGFPKNELYYRFYISKLFFCTEMQEVYYLGIQLNGNQSLKGIRIGTPYSTGDHQIESYDDRFHNKIKSFNTNGVFSDNNYIYIPYLYAKENMDNYRESKYMHLMVFNKHCSYSYTKTDYKEINEYLLTGKSHVKDNIIYTILKKDSDWDSTLYETDFGTGCTISQKKFNNKDLIPEQYRINFAYFLDKEHVLISYSGILKYVKLLDETYEYVLKSSSASRIYTDDNTIHAIVDGYKCVYSIEYENGKYSFPLISKILIMDSPKDIYSITKDTVLYPLDSNRSIYQFRDKEKVIKNIIIK
ncbi:phage tail protein [Clostridium senegalense]